MSACGSAAHLQTFVTAVETLIDEANSGENATFSALDNKLTTLLQAQVGGEPIVDITPSNNNETSNLEVLIELNYPFNRTETLNIDLNGVLQDIDPDSEGLEYFTQQLLPDSSATATIKIEANLKFTLAVGIEYTKADEVGKNKHAYIKDSTGIEATFYATVDFYGRP